MMGGSEPISVELNGETRTLHEWADAFNIPFDSVYGRWRKGIRDPAVLIFGIRSKHGRLDDRLVLSPENIQWLIETRGARRGSPEEWEIACELIGANRRYAYELKEYMERKGLA